MATALWWAANAFVALAVLPMLALLALRIIKAMQVVHAAALDIRGSLAEVAGGIPPAVAALEAVAASAERLGLRERV